MDWFVRPLATIFFGGALGASSLSINLHTQREKERQQGRQMVLTKFIRLPVMRISVCAQHSSPSSGITYHIYGQFAQELYIKQVDKKGLL